MQSNGGVAPASAFPAAHTVRMPAFFAWVIFWYRTSSLSIDPLPPTLMLIIRTLLRWALVCVPLFVISQVYAWASVSVEKDFVSPMLALTITKPASYETPATPFPLFASAATIPATWVPCPIESATLSTPSSEVAELYTARILLIRSSWATRQPVSITATDTFGDDVVSSLHFAISQARYASTDSSSHCFDEPGSLTLTALDVASSSAG